jgi:hypothetical protein
MSVCTRPTHLVGFFSYISLKQLSVGRHVASLEQIVHNPNNQIFVLNPKYWMLSREVTNDN